jgi:hypothetical protein
MSFSDSWAVREFSGVDLGDQRLNHRFMKLAEDFSKHPEFSINQACDDWSAAKAAYRFFKNDNFSEQDLLTPHFKKTAERCKKHKCVLILQDTSVIGYSHHPMTKGLGRIGGCPDPEGIVHGFYIHSALAITTDGLPLGLLSNEMWSRSDKPKPEKRTDHLIHTEDKESFKWINALENTHEALENKVHTITICDRECDIFDFYLSALDLNTNVIVRCREDRQIGTRSIPEKLSERFGKAQRYEKTITIRVPIEEVGKKKNKKAAKYREATLEIKSVPMTLTPSRKATQVVKEKIDIFAVEAKEINPPPGLETAHWVLLTTLPVESFEESMMVIDFYSMRWQIENYFRVLKSGCTVEKCRLNECDRLMKYLSLFSVIAWRIYWLTFVRRIDPESSCETVLTKSEWETLFTYFAKARALEPPSVHQATIWLARLGGFLARKGDGDPGPTCLWRGWSRLQDMTQIRNIMADLN